MLPHHLAEVFYSGVRFSRYIMECILGLGKTTGYNTEIERKQPEKLA